MSTAAQTPSTTINVARWAALGLGIAYGWSHQRLLVRSEAKRKAEAAYKHKQELINKAKDAYAAKLAAENPSDVITDPNDPRFDFEKLLKSLEKSK